MPINSHNTDSALSHVRSILDTVTDPEIPALTINEMGILRGVEIKGDSVVVTITPTYSGCPAIDQITDDITKVLAEHSYPSTQVALVLSPAWTTDWMSDEAKEKLRQYGIAPPCKTSLLDDSQGDPHVTVIVACPICCSFNTKLVSHFGSTACKSFWQCADCLEPFDYFKPI
jgi:ring-1,2-phenylacetyl-CoA epoxidase subunit PaaD